VVITGIEDQQVEARIYDLHGKLVQSHTLQSNEKPATQLDISQLTPAMYLLQLCGKSLLHRERIVVTK
jgi:hypothetical protein